MKKYLYFFVLLLLIFCKSGILYAQQQKKTDSLIALLLAAKEDTNKVKILISIGKSYVGSDPENLTKYTQQALELAKKINWGRGAGQALNLMAINEMAKGKMAGALDYLLGSLKAYEEINDSDGIAHQMKNVAVVYVAQGAYPKALEYSLSALKIHEAQGAKDKLGADYGHIGGFYLQMRDYPKALEYTMKALAINESLHDTDELIINYNNLGNIYKEQGVYEHALEYYFKSLHLTEITADMAEMATVLGRIGVTYRYLHNYPEAMAYQFKGLRYRSKDDIANTARDHGYIGQTYLAIANDSAVTKQDSLIQGSKTANIGKAIEYLRKAFASGTDVLDMNNIKDFSLALSEAQALVGNYKEAYEYHKQYAAAKDSLFSKDSKNKIANLEADREKELKEKQIEVQRLQIVAAKNEQKYYIAGLALLVLVSGSLFGRYRIVSGNKKQLEEKNKIIAIEKDNADTQRLRAENSERAKQQFLANMSHEIRTPMNAVNGMTDLLIAKNPRPEQLTYLNVISKSADILLHIINDILDMSKIEVGKMELETIDFSIDDTIEQVKDTLSFRAEEKGLQLITTIDDEVNEVLIGDPFRLNQILINLGGNAIKFTNKGSVEIKAKCISEEAGKQQVRFSVTDTGMGIPADKLQDLFESFKQVNRSDTRKFGGTGLGLSISKQLVELQGGSITVESKEGSGTIFSFVLTYAAGSKEKLDERVRHDQQADGRMLNGLRILLADDNEYNRLVVSETLHLKAEVLIDEAVNGLKALQLLEKNDYDIVLMDVQMPEMNGFEATQYIRTKLPAPKNKIPVIALTASMLKLDIDQCYQHGMNTFVPKPFKSWQLINAIAEQTGRSAADIKQPSTEKQAAKDIVIPITEGVVTDLTYLTKFCEGDKERIKQYIGIYLAAIQEFEEKANQAIAAKDMVAVAALMHTFKPKWMMMGMKQTNALGHKIELLCNEPGQENKVTEHVAALIKQNRDSVKELAGWS